LQKIIWIEVNKQLLKKSLILILIISIVITFFINWYFHWNQPFYLFFINTFLWVVGWISLIVYLIEYKKDGWIPIMFTVIVATTAAFMAISATVFIPILFNQNNEYAMTNYINENIKGVIYSDYAGITFNPAIIKEKYIFFVFNKGNQNIDENL